MDAFSARSAFVDELTAVTRKLRTLFDARARAQGLTFSRARLLLHLSQTEGATQKELAELLEVEQPTMGRLIDALEEAGLVQRRALEGDRRVRQIFLTETARTQAADVLGFADEMRKTVLDGIEEADLLTATRVLRAITRNVATAS